MTQRERSRQDALHISLTIKPDDLGALKNWGVALMTQAMRKTGEDADRLFEQAREKYSEALAIEPDDAGVLNNWGIALSAQAETKTEKAAAWLFAEAGKKYTAAVALNPTAEDALHSWGTSLLRQAKSNSGAKADRLFDKAREKFRRSEEIMPESSTYALACLAALTGDKVECRKWLDKGKEAGTLPSREQLLHDPDLRGVRKSKWFRDFL